MVGAALLLAVVFGLVSDRRLEMYADEKELEKLLK